MTLFPQQKSGGTPKNRIADKTRNTFGQFNGEENPDGIGSSAGSAARFFYCAKASREDRGEGNTHPTVKPTDLMRYLCRLVTPPGGIILDPFMGSGSTIAAAKACGLKSIGIEANVDYFRMAIQAVPQLAQIEID